MSHLTQLPLSLKKKGEGKKSQISMLRSSKDRGYTYLRVPNSQLDGVMQSVERVDADADTAAGTPTKKTKVSTTKSVATEFGLNPGRENQVLSSSDERVLKGSPSYISTDGGSRDTTPMRHGSELLTPLSQQSTECYGGDKVISGQVEELVTSQGRSGSDSISGDDTLLREAILRMFPVLQSLPTHPISNLTRGATGSPLHSSTAPRGGDVLQIQTHKLVIGKVKQDDDEVIADWLADSENRIIEQGHHYRASLYGKTVTINEDNTITCDELLEQDLRDYHSSQKVNRARVVQQKLVSINSEIKSLFKDAAEAPRLKEFINSIIKTGTAHQLWVALKTRYLTFELPRQLAHEVRICELAKSKEPLGLLVPRLKIAVATWKIGSKKSDDEVDAMCKKVVAAAVDADASVRLAWRQLLDRKLSFSQAFEELTAMGLVPYEATGGNLSVNQFNFNQNRDKSKVQCHNCGKLGHMRRQCRSKPSFIQQSSNHQPRGILKKTRFNVKRKNFDTNQTSPTKKAKPDESAKLNKYEEEDEN